MSKRHKKHHHEEHVDESWLIPYADLLTLLLALFIVLFAMGTIDQKKYGEMSRTFNQLFTGGTGVMEYDAPVEPTSPPVTADTKPKEQPNQEEIDKDQLELKELQEKVNSYIEAKGLKDKLGTELTDEGLLVTIRDNVLFNSGIAEVRKEDLKVATEISELLIMNPPRNIIISGHTDNVPIRTARYESNWELSVMRAVNFMKVILKNEKLDPKWFSAKGFGEFQPVASNKTEEGKGKNRRVEILILPRYQD